MLDLGKVIDMLFAVRQIETIEHACRAFAVQQDPDIVANQSAAQRHRVRREMTTSLQICYQSADMKTAVALLLQPAVLDDRILCANQLGNRVTEISFAQVAISAQVAFDDLSLA